MLNNIVQSPLLFQSPHLKTWQFPISSLPTICTKTNTHKMQTNPIFVLIILLCSLSTVTLSQIALNSSLSTLSPTQTWTSSNPSFSLQFLTLNTTNTNSNTPTFSLSITYDPSTPIWSAPASAAVEHGSSFHLHPSGDLQLLSPTNAILWHSNTSHLGVTHASLADTGNFMLLNDSDHVFWSSFDHPTDTIVPSQNFTVGMVLSSGLYSFSLNSTGFLNLEWNRSIVYFTSGLNSSVTTNLSGKSWLIVEEIGILSLYDSNLSTSIKLFYSSDYGDPDKMLRFLRLDSDGNLRLYRVDQGTDSPVVRWTAVSNQCLVFGYCGNMGICSYNETGPVCGCPSENFALVDEGNPRKGCRLNKEVKDCPDSTALLELDHTMFLTYPPEFSSAYFIGSAGCRGNCLSVSGQSCVASTSVADGSGQCFVKTTNFVSGYQSSTLPSTSYVKVCGPLVPNPPPPSDETPVNRRLKGWIIGVVILVTVVVLVLLEGSLWWWCCRKSAKFGSMSAQYALLEYASGAPVQFSYKELQQSTNGFKEKLGEGGFGSVYKGVLANKTVVAVKQLEGIEQGEKQFRMEVAAISSTHHLNLVRLIGFCSEGRHRLLVYEIMKNGSLDSFLFGKETSSGSEKFLTWVNRFNVAVGTAKGITYLHEECRDCIVHCDIKPENILLDDNYNAKVSDFGLAKLVNPKDHRYLTLTSVRGTRGYLAPEWLANLPITLKTDVFSFGMVLLEIISGRRNFEVSDDTNRKKFSVWAYEEFDKGNISGIVDKRLGEGEVDMDQVTRAIQVSFWCIQEQPSERPMMGKVVQMLEGIMEIQRPPVPKGSTDGRISGPSLTTSSISARCTSSASGIGPSSSSFRMPQDLSSFTSMNLEGRTSSLVRREA